LLKKPGGHVGGIGLEKLVTFDEECSNRRGEYTRLETILLKVNGVQTPTSRLKAHINEDFIHGILPTSNHFAVLPVSL
jgi:hypothetical protein